MRRIFVSTLLVLAMGATGTRAEHSTGSKENPQPLKDSIVVTADRFGRTPGKSVWPASSVSLDQIATPLTMQQALDGRSGLDVRQYNGVGSVSTLSNWGLLNRNMLLLYDGRVVKDYSLGGFNLSDFSPDEFESIELVKGPQSAFYGSDAIGGVVNLVTRSVMVDRARFTSRIGSQNLRQYSFDLSHRLGNFGIGGFGEFDIADNRRPNAGATNQIVTLRAEYLSPDDHHRLILSGRYFSDSLGVPGPIPDPAYIPVFGDAQSSSLYDHQTDRNYSVDASYRFFDSSLGDAQLDLFWEKKNLDYHSLFNYQSFGYSVDTLVNPPESTLTVDSVDDHSRSIYNKRSAGISGRYSRELSHLSFSGGIDWLSGSLRATEDDRSLSTRIQGLDSNSSYSFNSYSFWSRGQDQLDVWSGTTLSPAVPLRVDLSGRLQFVKDRQTQPTYDVGVIYALSPMLRCKLGYGYAFRLPTIAEQYADDQFTAGNSHLEPETSRSLIGTVSWGSTERFAQIDATVFHQTVASLIQYFYDPSIFRSVPKNVDRFRTTGLDLSFNLRPTRRLMVSFGGVYQSARQSVNGSPSMVEAFYVPDIKWRMDVRGRLNDIFSASGGVIYTADRLILLY